MQITQYSGTNYVIELESGVTISGPTLAALAAEVQAYNELCEFRENITLVRVDPTPLAMPPKQGA